MNTFTQQLKRFRLLALPSKFSMYSVARNSALPVMCMIRNRGTRSPYGGYENEQRVLMLEG